MAYRIVTIGTSLGGFHALAAILGRLPKDFPLPIVAAQHRSVDDSDAFVALLTGHTTVPVREVEDKDEILPGHVYLCPANYHVLIEGTHFALSTDGPVLCARPSIDVLFESAADACGSGVVGVLLTGMSHDGVTGLAKIKQRGGLVVVQDPSTAEGPAMPRAALESVQVDKMLPLEEIGTFLTELVKKEPEARSQKPEVRIQ